MNYLSDKAKGMKPYVAGIQPEGGGWIKLNTNENPYPPSPKVAAALREAEASELRLYPNADSASLCEAIAGNLGIGAENVFAGNGSDEVLALAYQAFFSGKQNVLTPDISYGFYPVWNQMYEVSATYVPLRDDYSIRAADYKGSNGVIIANPNAPTGIALGLPEIEEITAANPSGVVMVDEAYIDFADVRSAVALIGKYENLLVVRTFSKSHSLAGLRVGFAVGGRRLIEALRMMKDSFNSYPLGRLPQMLAKAAIEDAGYWEDTRLRIIRTREETAARLRGMGYNVLGSGANFLFMECGDAKGIYENLLAGRILVRYWEKHRIDRFLRVTVGLDSEMEEFIRCIGKLTKPR